jgi:hypothetical protein
LQANGNTEVRTRPFRIGGMAQYIGYFVQQMIVVNLYPHYYSPLFVLQANLVTA